MSTGALVAQTLWEQPAIVCSDLRFTLIEMEPPYLPLLMRQKLATRYVIGPKGEPTNILLLNKHISKMSLDVLLLYPQISGFITHPLSKKLLISEMDINTEAHNWPMHRK